MIHLLTGLDRGIAIAIKVAGVGVGGVAGTEGSGTRVAVEMK